MAASLKGLRVLVTRPEQQQAGLCEAIRALGGEPVALPLISIEPVVDESEQRLLQQGIAGLDNYQLLIFVSTNAARYGAEWIDAWWPQFPVGVEVMAIGPATAAELQQRLNVPVQVADGGMDSEAILALPRLNTVEQQRVAIFRGQGGRELLAASLRERGAEVDYFQVYRRQPVRYENDPLGTILASPGLDVLTVTSGESLHTLRTLAGEHMASLSLLPLLVPSARVADMAREAGFHHAHDAGGASPERLVAALQELIPGADNKA